MQNFEVSSKVVVSGGFSFLPRLIYEVFPRVEGPVQYNLQLATNDGDTDRRLTDRIAVMPDQVEVDQTYSSLVSEDNAL